VLPLMHHLKESYIMKTTLFLLSTIVTLILSSVTAVEIQAASTMHGTAVIAAKTSIKGGDKNTLVLPSNLTPKQGELLSYAYKVAKEDGHKHPEYFQGLIYQESKAGGMKGYEVAGQEFGLKPMERYYGVPQIKLAATKDVLKKYPFLGSFRVDEEIIAKLMTDDKWAIRVGSKYLLMVGKDKSPESALVAYNKGEGGARGVDPSTNNYATSIIKHTKTVVQFLNTKNKIVKRPIKTEINLAKV
jgi:hypothetical protein